jgi:hypothetical protein
MNDLTHHLNWEVEQKQLLLPDSRLSTSYALTRSDNGRILSVRSERYHPVYNRDMESIRQRITERSGLQFKGYQEFQYGKRLLAFYENPDKHLTLCDQPVKDYLIIGNSHDTSSKLFVGTSNFMFRCENQFSEKIRTIDWMHNRPFNIDELNISEVISSYETGRKQLYRRMERLQSQRASMELILQLAKQLMGTDRSPRQNSEVEQLKYDERTLLLLNCIERELRELGPTLWGVFNGVTRYTSNHLKGNPGFGVTNGVGERMNREALRILMETV